MAKENRIKLKDLVQKDPQRQLWDSVALVLAIAFIISLFFEGHVVDLILLFLQTQVSMIGVYLRANEDR